MTLGRGDERLHPVEAEAVAEVGVAELALEAALLLLFHATACFERQAHGPFEILFGNLHLGIREEQLDQGADRLVDALEVTAAEGTAEVHTILHGRQAAAIAEAAPALAEEIAHQAEVAGEMFIGIELGEIPAGSIGVDPVMKGRVVAPVAGQRAEEVADALLLLSKLPTITMPPSARMLSVPRLNSSEAM